LVEIDQLDDEFKKVIDEMSQRYKCRMEDEFKTILNCHLSFPDDSTLKGIIIPVRGGLPLKQFYSVIRNHVKKDNYHIIVRFDKQDSGYTGEKAEKGELKELDHSLRFNFVIDEVLFHFQMKVSGECKKLSPNQDLDFEVSLVPIIKKIIYIIAKEVKEEEKLQVVSFIESSNKTEKGKAEYSVNYLSDYDSPLAAKEKDTLFYIVVDENFREAVCKNEIEKVERILVWSSNKAVKSEIKGKIAVVHPKLMNLLSKRYFN